MYKEIVLGVFSVSRQKTLLILTLVFCFFRYEALAGTNHSEINSSLTNTQFIYTPEEMLSFNISTYLQGNAPHLVDYAEVISHWSGYSSISPKIIIALIEYQTGLISTGMNNDLELQKPLGEMSMQVGFSEQIKDIALRLAEQYYQNGRNSQDALENVLTQDSGDQKYRQPSFYSTFNTLFPGVDRSDQSSDTAGPTGALPPETLLQLPYPVGESWHFGGSHTSNGSGSYPQSSLDFYVPSGGWGSDTSGFWVSASTGGTAVRHSSCFVEVIQAPGGWSTTYYHLDNVQVVTNQGVSRNDPLANYANTLSQALCDGGNSTGPHQHFSLKYNGAYSDLNGAKLSGYSVHTGRTSYDTDCDYFWIEEDGDKHCAWSSLYNPGLVIPTPLAPQNISASDGSYSDRVEVNWSGSASALSYRLFRCTLASTSSCVQIYTGNATHYSDYSAVLATTYFYRAKACNLACSGFSNYNTGYRTENVEDLFPWNLFLPSMQLRKNRTH